MAVEMDQIKVATATAPTNIAVVKYWGKRDSKLNLPINSSLSVTLDQADLRTVTSAATSAGFEQDRVWLNGKEEDVAGNKRLVTVFAQIRLRSMAKWKEQKVHVVSENSFPTAAGLASSASGYACLTKALAEIFEVEGDVSDIARMGSGSASRSLFGGYARWSMGEKADGTDSVASVVQPQEHWDNMHALICVVSDHKKTTSSTGGMIDSVNTSALLAHRAAHVVPQRMVDMEKAIGAKDFASFAELTMKDSNSFHATCLDTFPPIKYMNDTSFGLVQLVHAHNAELGKTVAAYTFDAGPNAVIFVEDMHVDALLAKLLASEACGAVEVRGRTTKAAEVEAAVKYIIHTKVGPGAAVQPEDSDLCLINKATGLPK